jgi:hypothetical protein
LVHHFVASLWHGFCSKIAVENLILQKLPGAPFQARQTETHHRYFTRNASAHTRWWSRMETEKSQGQQQTIDARIHGAFAELLCDCHNYHQIIISTEA